MGKLFPSLQPWKVGGVGAPHVFKGFPHIFLGIIKQEGAETGEKSVPQNSS